MTISIITATYNSAATLRTTFDSILQQTYRDIDYIVIDGGSTDGTLDIIREYEPRFAGHLRWISEPDHGIYDAMNKGIRMAKGDVVGILNSDDFFSSDDILATVASNITDVDAVYADIHFVRPDNLSRCVRHYSSRNFRPWTVRFGYMPAHPSFFVRRHIYERYGLYSLDYKIASDFDMMVRLFCKHKIRARYIARDFVTMRTGGISTSNLSHRILITREDARACRANGIYSNFILCSVKYITKVFEFL